MILDALMDALLDSLRLLPFLLVTYVLMELLEHKASEKTVSLVKKSGKLGPLFGGVLGVVPQCGFSAAGSTLYSAGIISLGTVISIYLSTSDEMLPILISEKAPIDLIVKIIFIKIVIGVIAGFVIDFILTALGKGNTTTASHDDLHTEECGVNVAAIAKFAITHSLQIFVYVAILSFVINVIIGYVGEATIASFLSNKSVFGIFIAALVGLIPNCAASVVITELYVKGMLSFGAMMSGLLVSAGVGLLVLFKSNKNIKDNIKTVAILYVTGVVSGLIILLFS